MDDRNIAGQLALLATEVDSLAKTLVPDPGGAEP